MPATLCASQLAGWGRVRRPGGERFAEQLLAATPACSLSRGLGRSYGDSSLTAGPGERALNTTLADRLLAFDLASGRLRAEAGFTMRELYRVFLPRGWFAPVTPGTSFVTLGGMVASDVHGKNHHSAGTFGRHITALRIAVADGRVIDCSPTTESELFWATIGGMGLTGHILEVEFTLDRVPSPWIYQLSERVPNLATFLRRLEEVGRDWPMTMGWIDCISRGAAMGRGHLMAGRWATAAEAPRGFPRQLPRLRLPCELPDFALSPLSVRAFNFLYYWKHLARQKRGIVHPETFFYPLDAVLDWNKAYGRRGFTQYQVVLPKEDAARTAPAFLELLTREGGASFLCVIKDCGEEGRGLLSFPMPGISVALDIKITDRTPELVDRLNRFVIAAGGRTYLTKDLFTRAEDYRAMDPRLDQFLAVRRAWDPALRLRSAQSVRLFGDPPREPTSTEAAP
jgi:FAD/FMN-containing dehydrogenase